MKQTAITLLTCLLLASCDSITDIFGRGDDLYPIHIEWVTTNSVGDKVLTDPDPVVAPLVKAAARRWARILAPTPVEPGSHTVEHLTGWWPAGHEVKYGLTIGIEVGACAPGCASGGLPWNRDPNVISGWMGVASGISISGLDAKGRKQWEGVFVHEIGHILMWDYSTESEYRDGWLYRWITEPRVVEVWRQHGGRNYPSLSFDGIHSHLSGCAARNDGINDIMSGHMAGGTSYGEDGSYRLTKLSASMVAPIYTVNLDVADSFIPGCNGPPAENGGRSASTATTRAASSVTSQRHPQQHAEGGESRRVVDSGDQPSETIRVLRPRN